MATLEDLIRLRREIDEKIEKLKAINKRRAIENGLSFYKRAIKKEIKRIPLEYVPLLQRNWKGLPIGVYINIVGKSFSGKSYITLNILRSVCKEQKALFFSFEMYEGLLARRMKNWSEEELKNLYIEQKKSHINDIEDIILSMKDEAKVIAIDSRMKIKSDEKSEYEKNTDISLRLSKLTQLHGVTIILINQIAESDLREGRLAIKGSGDQYYDSDMILFIVPDDEKKTKQKEGGRKITYYCTKDRVNERTWKETEIIPEIIRVNKDEDIKY